MSDVYEIARNFARAKLCNGFTSAQWLAIQNSVSNDADLETFERMALVDGLGELAALAPVQTLIPCGQCEGSGETEAMGEREPCPVCDATGRIEQ